MLMSLSSLTDDSHITFKNTAINLPPHSIFWGLQYHLTCPGNHKYNELPNLFLPSWEFYSDFIPSSRPTSSSEFISWLAVVYYIMLCPNFSFTIDNFYFDFIVPAKIASFDEEFIATYKEDVKLLCQAVGIPSPDIRYESLS